MKEEVPEITDAVNKLWALSERYDRGEVILWENIEPIAGQRNEGRPRHIINKWRKRIERERGIVTLVSHTVGVRLLTARETAIEIPRLRQKKAYRQIGRAMRQTSLVDHSKLTAHERRLLNAQRDHMASQRTALHRSQKELRNGIKKTETNPRRVVA